MINPMSEFSKYIYQLPIKIIDLNGKASEIEKDLCYYLAHSIYSGKLPTHQKEMAKKYNVGLDVVYRTTRVYRLALCATIVYEFKIIYNTVSLCHDKKEEVEHKAMNVLIHRLYKYLSNPSVGGPMLDLKKIFSLINRVIFKTGNDKIAEEFLEFDKVYENMPDLTQLIRSEIEINKNWLALLQRLAKLEEKENKKHEKETCNQCN